MNNPKRVKIKHAVFDVFISVNNLG